MCVGMIIMVWIWFDVSLYVCVCVYIIKNTKKYWK